MTISESQAGTIIRCDRCGQIIETITGSQAANRVDSTSLPNPQHSDQSSQSSLYQTPINTPLMSDNSQTAQAGLETEKNQPEQNNNTSTNTTIAVNNNQAKMTKDNRQVDRDLIAQIDLGNPSNDSDTIQEKLPKTSDAIDTKIDAKNTDDFVVDHVAKKSTIIINDINGDFGTNKKADWRQILAGNSNKPVESPVDKLAEKSGSSGNNQAIAHRSKPPAQSGTVEVPNNDETILATQGGKNNADRSPVRVASGNSHESNHYSDSGRFGSTINLDLTKRVMGTINQSGVSAADSTDTNDGGYGVHRILRQHQRGGMGRIMIAYDRHLKRDVALKELHKEVIDDISIVRRFVGEAEITAQLEHPGIVPIHWLGLDKDGLPYYTMKLIKGKTYQDAIKDYHRNPSKQELKNLVRRLVSICKTIGFAHERGVIHRDLKPANIMLGEHGETLVMDWGLAKPLHQHQQNEEDDEYNSAMTRITGEMRTELTMVGAIVGTPAFMSPEQASPEENVVGTHSDIYSLGTILYYLLAGQTAFSGRSTREVLAKVRAAAPIRPSEIKLNVPAGLEAICMKAMAKNPTERYQSAKELDEDLCRWLDDMPVKAIHITPIQKLVRLIGRHWVTAISIPLAIISIILLTIFVIKFDRSHNASAFEEVRRVAIEDEVDLTEQNCVIFRGGHNIDVEMDTRFSGGKMIVCKLKPNSGMNSGLLEMIAPSDATWDLTNRQRLKFSVFEYRSGAILPLDNLKIRMGRGSAYFEFQPAKATTDWWAKRKYGNWCTYWVPITGSQDWPKTISDNPQLENIDWIEFHFELKPEDKFQIDDIMFLKD